MAHAGSGSAGATAERFAAGSLWLLPVFGLLLALSTLTHEPDRATDFEGYARYVTTDVFVVSHLVGSIVGAGLGAVGAVGVAVLLARTRHAAGALTGAALTILAAVLLAATFGGAVFAQPGIGRAHLAGVAGMADLNADTVYGAPRVLTAMAATLLLVASAVVLGVAVARTARPLRWLGVGYAGTLTLFAVVSIAFSALQPVVAALFTVVAVLLAVRLPREVRRPEAASTRADAPARPA
ncbi:hypothetical protein [Puerhibacterium sp. TATVAM-FAB25]|uniref:hypothetical protein n=1 Tax=Puerhibacterium sp. TATVAM-FAB25 TaxID=3093699 RepID=UPI0039789C0C